MTALQLDHLNLSVNSFDQTAEWYGRVFDFNVVEEDVLEDGNVRWGVIRGGDASLCIYEHPEFTFETKDARMKRGVHSLSHFGMRIDDRKAWRRIGYWQSCLRCIGPGHHSGGVRSARGYSWIGAVWKGAKFWGTAGVSASFVAAVVWLFG